MCLVRIPFILSFNCSLLAKSIKRKSIKGNLTSIEFAIDNLSAYPNKFTKPFF